MAGTLYVVATPIGNLEDTTFRAVRVLKEVDLIAAEDTRHSRKLLTHFGIKGRLVSYYDQVERHRAPKLVEQLVAGRSVALISDAGTPGIADPGYRLVRAAIEAGISVVPVPGPSVVTAALSVSGLPTDRFTFEGFVPARRAARRKFYEDLRREPRTIVCFEAGRRLLESLADLEAALGDRSVVVAREVTKRFETLARGQVSELRGHLGAEPVRGEATLLIAAASPESMQTTDDMRRAVAEMRAEGLGLKEIARTLADRGGWSSRDIYRIGLEKGGRRQKAEGSG
jgi:16S rRNA (cytidine1402-2'-O)-methyltransferase